jgi:AcrR family transcriptional regulator
MLEQIHNCENFQKFLALPEEKRERIINAAMKEFLTGYKKASTDNIVREAGISKGLLFHYFGTKERLYNFLCDYSVDIMQREYIGLINIEQPDILESIWQLSLLKRDMSVHFPSIFDFLVSVFVDAHVKSEETIANLKKFHATRAKIMDQVYAHANTSLFREDLDPNMVMQIITWTLDGYGRSKTSMATPENLGEATRENYDMFLEEFQEILNTLRKCLYKAA